MDNQISKKTDLKTKTKLSLTTKILITLGVLSFASAISVGLISMLANKTP